MSAESAPLNLNSKNFCQLAGVCSGCEWIQVDYQKQLELKKAELKKWGDEVALSIQSAGDRQVRSRLDLTLESSEGKSRLGFYNRDRGEIVDMQTCPMVVPELNLWLQDFRKTSLPKIKKGSLRLRVAPDGRRGVWIDFSNIDIKEILEEGSWLEELSQLAVVEIGQRNKRLVRKEGRWKLGDPELYPWFETYLLGKPQVLYLPIAGFTQTGWKGNRLLVQQVSHWAQSTGQTHWLELFCGNGNFTLPLAALGFEVKALELDAFALQGLEKAAEESGLKSSIEILRKDLYRSALDFSLPKAWLVDPPRSGLGRLLEWMKDLNLEQMPTDLIYVSCYLESFKKDYEVLKSLGFKCRQLHGVDQFPNTPHCEWVSYFHREA